MFRSPDLIYLGIAFVFMWSIGFWKVFKRSQLVIPRRFLGGSKMLRRIFIYLIGCVGWGFIIFSLMGPREPLSGVENEVEVIDIFFVVDISNSMQAIDFKPNRLEVAKKKIKKFISGRIEDRIGLIVFAESAFTLLPLTTDISLVQSMVNKINEVNLQSGTNIGDAIGLAVGRSALSHIKNKIIILLTDGVSNVGSMTPLEAANEAKKKNLRIYTIGIGSRKGALLPQKNLKTGRMRYVPLPGGSVDLKTLKQIAEITGGKHYYAEDEGTLKKIFKTIQTLEKSKIKTFGKTIYKEKYIFYLMIGVLLLAICELSRRYIIREGS